MFDDKETLRGLFHSCNEKVWQDYRLDLREVRDLHTGMTIGMIDEDVFHIALVDEGVLDDSEDGEVLAIEDLADALLVRSLASARPSPALNRPTHQSLRRLLDSNPTTVCAYLLNRYRLRDWRKLNHRDDSWFDDMLHRVKVWEKIGFFAREEDADRFESIIRSLTHWLLELDSKCNLHSLNAPTGWFETFLSLDSLDQFDIFTQEFALLATPLIVEADKRFTIGNRMASGAFVKSWFDNPALSQRKVEIANRKKQAEYDKYGPSDELGKLLREEANQVREAKLKAKKLKDSQIISGRSSRSRSAKLVNKHADKLNSLFRTLTEVTVGDGVRPLDSKPAPVKATGLPMFKKG